MTLSAMGSEIVGHYETAESLSGMNGAGGRQF